MQESVQPLIKVKNISKEFSKVKVLNNIDLELYPGEVHAIIGENGAGKSTLMKIICGVYQPTEGEIFYKGEKIELPTPHDARDLGIALIHQEPLTFPDLSVTENIYAGHTKEDKELYVTWNDKHKRSKEILDSLGVKIDVKSKIKGLSVADQQMVEIASALSQNAKVIVMDEPTASITTEEVKILFDIINQLKEQGKIIVFISHRLDEIKEISDRLTVLRDGEKIGTCDSASVTIDEIIKMMIGRTMDEQIPKKCVDIGEKILEIKDLCVPGEFSNISLEVKKGEIVGLAGLVGAGRTEIAKAIFGLMSPNKGQIFLHGKEVKINSPKDAINNRIAYVPEDRGIEGLYLDFPISENVTSAIPKKISKKGWVNRQKEQDITTEYVNKLRIKIRENEQKVQELSGGNQQKVVISKWMLTGPELLILDEPTRGIDVGAKAEVYNLIGQLAQQGKGILLISSELPEILGLSDRIYVIRDGQVNGMFDKEDATDERVMSCAAGNS